MDIQDIINTVAIEDYIGQYVELTEQNGELFGLSPFRQENTPSFSVTPATQLFYDFSSHIGGNVLTFIEKYHKCSFKEAVNILKQYANIDDNYVDTRLTSTKIIKRFKPIQKKARETKHTILDENYMSRYEKDTDKLNVWADEGISYEVMEKYQVRYDPFSNRLVYPIRDLQGNIISIKGRTLDKDYKEKKLRKYTYFQSIGDLDIIFGYYEHLQNFKDKKEIILFEGEKSVMLCDTWEIYNTGAILTSHLNPLQINILLKLGVKIVFALDKEINIKEDDNIKKLSKFLKIEYIKDCNNILTEKDAPVDKGKDVWLELYERRLNLN
jgi:DNA primase